MIAPITKAPPATSGPERYWAIIVAHADAFTVRQIRDGLSLQVTRRAIRRYLVGLIDLGLVEVIGPRPVARPNAWPETVYRCLKPRLTAPMVSETPGSTHGRAKQQIWNAMRALAQFTVDELVVTASTNEIAATRSHVEAFVRGLRRHGLVRVLQPKRGGRGGSTPAIMALVKSANSGPKPPCINRRSKAVFDPNRRCWIGLAAEVSA